MIMKTMKKIGSVLLAAAMLLSAAACGSSGGGSSTAAPSGDGSSTAESSQGGASAGGDTVTVCYHGDTYVKDADGNDVMKDIFQDFTDETGINVELTYIANSDWADYTTKVQTLFASGTAPDVIYVAVENQEAFIQNDMLQPLDPYLDAHPEIVEDYEENVAEALRNAAQYDDGLYGLLNCYETCVMWLNKDILAEAGLEVPDPNWNWDDFVSYCETIADKTDKFAYCIPTTYFTANGWYYSFGTGYVNDDYTEVTFDSDESKELMQFWLDSYEKGWCPGDPFNLDGPVELASGRIAMTSVGRWGSATCYNNDMTNVATAYMPAKYSDKKVSAWGFLGVSSKTDNYDAAAALACWTASYDFSKRYCSEVNGNIPARTDVNTPDNYLFDWDGQEIFYTVADSAVGMQNPTCYAELETIWKSAVTNVLSGAKDVDTAVNDAAAEMQSSLDS